MSNKKHLTTDNQLNMGNKENTWIKLIDEKPTEKGIYLTLHRFYSGNWKEEYLLWLGSDGFQPLDYGKNREDYPINMNVTHWLEVVPAELPITEAIRLIIKTEVFFHQDGLNEFVTEHNIEEFGRYGNATEYIISGVPEDTLTNMREIFKSNGTHINVRKK